jgi:hypothetical protein
MPIFGGSPDLSGYVKQEEKGAPDGVASLDSTGVVRQRVLTKFRGQWAVDSIAYQTFFDQGSIPSAFTTSTQGSGSTPVLAASPNVGGAGPYPNSVKLATPTWSSAHRSSLHLDLASLNIAGITRVKFWWAHTNGWNKQVTVHKNGDPASITRAVVNSQQNWLESELTGLASTDTLEWRAAGSTGMTNNDSSYAAVTAIRVYAAEAPYMRDQFVIHNGTMWKSDTDNNSGEPGVSGWTAASPFGTRASVVKTTAALAAGASEAGTINMASGYRLLNLTTNAPARVRLYSSTAQRDADVSRAKGVAPTGNHGLIFEAVTASGLLDLDVTPSVLGHHKTLGTAAIPITITNEGASSQAVTATLIYQATE